MKLFIWSVAGGYLLRRKYERTQDLHIQLKLIGAKISIAIKKLKKSPG